MVLWLKPRKSRSSPGIIARAPLNPFAINAASAAISSVAGWSSPVARQAHNLKVVGSNPTPATRGRNSLHKASEPAQAERSEEHTSELQSLMRISYAVFCLKNKNKK